MTPLHLQNIIERKALLFLVNVDQRIHGCPSFSKVIAQLIQTILALGSQHFLTDLVFGVIHGRPSPSCTETSARFCGSARNMCEFFSDGPLRESVRLGLRAHVLR